MAAEFRFYKALLVGKHSAGEHITKLRDHTVIRTIMEEKEDSFRLQVISQADEIPSHGEIKSRISQHAKELLLDVPALVRKTATDIQRAYVAETIVREGRLSITIAKDNVDARAEVVLRIKSDKDPIIRDICNRYALIRILEVSTALDMTLDEQNVYEM